MNQSRFIAIAVGILLMAACNSEKKVTTYEDLYKEQALTILVAPAQDNAKRPQVKTTQDQVLCDELTQAAVYMRQSCIIPLVDQGYYVIPPLSGDVILNKLGMGYRQLMMDDIKKLNTDYGIDAVLLLSVHKWQQFETNEIIVFTEYTLRSTKTGLELMHTWVRGVKLQPVDVKGEPVELAADNAFIRLTGLESPIAHRCILMDQMSDFVLRSLPTSASRWMYQHDRYTSANPAFYGFVMNPDGSVERSEYNEDAFGNECFTTD